MSTLYEIATDIQVIDDLIESSMIDAEGNPRDPTEEEKAAILEMIAESESAFRGKAERICQFRANLMGDAEMFKVEEARLVRRRLVKEHKAAALKMYLDLAMTKIKSDKLEVGVFRLRMQKNTPSVTIINQAELPEDYIRVVPEIREPNKVKIKQDFEIGAYPWGAITQTKSIRIE
jgi:hypothetical protein